MFDRTVAVWLLLLNLEACVAEVFVDVVDDEDDEEVVGGVANNDGELAEDWSVDGGGGAGADEVVEEGTAAVVEIVSFEFIFLLGGLLLFGIVELKLLLACVDIFIFDDIDNN